MVYADWLAGADRDHRAARLFDLVPGPNGQATFAPDSLLDGATTNQPLTWQVMEKYPEIWAEWLAAQAGDFTTKTPRHEDLQRDQ